METLRDELMMDERFDVPDADRIRVSRGDAVEPVAEEEPLSAEEEAELAPTRAFAFVDEMDEPDAPPAEREPLAEAPPPRGDWLEEVPGEATMDFPARSNHISELSRPPMDREEVKERVEYLFPRTETNWAVGGRSSRRAATG